jgi:hypothetical protein
VAAAQGEMKCRATPQRFRGLFFEAPVLSASQQFSYIHWESPIVSSDMARRIKPES